MGCSTMAGPAWASRSSAIGASSHQRARADCLSSKTFMELVVRAENDLRTLLEVPKSALTPSRRR